MGIFFSKPRPFNVSPYIGRDLSSVIGELRKYNVSINIVSLKDDDFYNHALMRTPTMTVLYNCTTNIVSNIYVD